MTQTQTYDEWLAAFYSNYSAGCYVNQRFGQAFSNALHDAGKSGIANALIYSSFDPFYSDSLSQDCLAFVGRVWGWALATGR